MVTGCDGHGCANASAGQSARRKRKRAMRDIIHALESRLPKRALSPAYPNALRGIGLMVLAVSTFTCLDTTSKYLAQHYPVAGIVFVRYIVQMVLMVIALAPRMGLQLVRTSNLKLQVVRGVMLTVSSLAFLTALARMPDRKSTRLNSSHVEISYAVFCL